MKYGVLWVDTQLDTSLYINIGNEIQSYYAIVELYRKMGIAAENIVPIAYSERTSFSINGGKLIMPINEWIGGFGNDRQFSNPFPFPEDIIPVFLGLRLLTRSDFPKDSIEYLKKYEPIGCRDEETAQFLRSFGINAYLFGCISLTLPFRKISDKADKIYLVDVPDEFRASIPKDILTNETFVERTHALHDEVKQLDPIRRYRVCEELLKDYAENAKLVVTSRLHCLLPCLGLGIPTIYVSENHSKRLAWIDKFARIYTRSEWGNVNWEQKDINDDICEVKQLMCDTAINAIQSAARGEKISSQGFEEIDSFWKDRPTYNYDNFAREVIDAELKHAQDGFKYIIWGTGIVGDRVYKDISQKFPNSEMVLAVDTFIRGEFHGKTIALPGEILNHKDAIVMIATYTGKDAVTAWLDENDNVPERRRVYFSTTSG